MVLKKQQFPNKFLQKNASSHQSYQTALDWLDDRSGIQGPLADEANDQISYRITEPAGQHEEVVLQFFSNGVIKSTSCTCHLSSQQEGLCSHVLASMMDLNDYAADQLPTQVEDLKQNKADQLFHNRNDEAVEAMLKNYWRVSQKATTSLAKTPVNFEYRLSIRGSESIHFYVMTMRVGLDYLYVVKDIEDLLYSLVKQETIEFGKGFTYDPSIHRIQRDDQLMLDLLSYIVQLMQSTSPGRSQANGSELYIPPQMLKEILLQLKRVDAGYVFNDFLKEEDSKKGQASYIYQDIDQLPLSFHINESNDHFYAFSTDRQSIKQLKLFPKTNVAYYEGGYYFLSDHQYQAISYLKDSFHAVDYAAIIMDAQQFSLFASNVLPQLRSSVHIEMEDHLSQALQTPELRSSLYIDYREPTLYVRPVFRYADQSIYPLEEENKASNSPSTLVVRDLVEENRKIELLVEALRGFSYDQSFAYADQLGTISDFLYQELKDLSQYFELMMTQPAQQLVYQPTEPSRLQIDVNKSTGLLDIHFQLEDIAEEDLGPLLAALQQSRKYYRLSDGKILNLQDPVLQEMNEAVQSLDLSIQDVKQHSQAPLYKGLSLDQTDHIQLGQNLEDMASQLVQPKQLDETPPQGLKAELRPFQQTGYSWLKRLDDYGFGGVLADDMGLGKTVQTIAYLWSKIKDQAGPCLVICPASVLYNWEYEFNKFAPQLKVQLIAGSKEDRQAILSDGGEPADVYISSYPLVLRDQDLYQSWHFTTMVLDEAQYVKNNRAKTTQAVRAIHRQQAIALSGTPIENNLSDLYSLFSIVMPGLFQSKQHFKSLDQRQIAAKIRPFVLRRLKSEVLFDLPEKMESIELVDLSPDQKKLYQTQVSVLKDDIQRYVAQDEWNKQQINVLSSLTRLRQICNHPALFIDDYKGDVAKLERLKEVLEEARENGKRIVLFSQFTRMLAHIRQLVESMDMDYHYLDGSTPAKDRLDLAHRFNMGDKDLFLISLKAGGTGLNLTGGDTVILFDSWWNPAVEDQAADRVHRLGQKNVVQIIRMIAKGTIEEKIYDLQAEKRQLLEDVIDSGGPRLADLTAEDLMALIDL